MTEILCLCGRRGADKTTLTGSVIAGKRGQPSFLNFNDPHPAETWKVFARKADGIVSISLADAGTVSSRV